MKRRRFILGMGSASIGGSALVGSGAYSRVESQRSAMIEVAHDEDAYVSLSKCDTPNGSYVDFDEGHLQILMSPENENHGDGPGQTLGAGINSNSTTWFDNVFQICNSGKEGACFWIEDDPDWPVVGSGKHEGERRIEFYEGSVDSNSIVGPANGIFLDVGECTCIGIRVKSYGLEAGDNILDSLSNQITIRADVDAECQVECVPCRQDIAARLQQLTLENVADSTVRVQVERPAGGQGQVHEEWGPQDVDPGEHFVVDDIPTSGQPELAIYIDDELAMIHHPDEDGGNEGETFHISCSAPVVVGAPLHYASDEPGNDLVVASGIDKDGNEIC